MIDLEEALVINSQGTGSHGAEMNRLDEICSIGFSLFEEDLAFLRAKLRKSESWISGTICPFLGARGPEVLGHQAAPHSGLRSHPVPR